MVDWNKLNPEVIAEFRANGGKVAMFGELPVVILHTIGARSGRVREIPLVLVLEGEEMFLFATAAGAARHPDWFFNLKANPRIEVERSSETFTADLVELSEADARQKIQHHAGCTPQLAEYVKSAAPRVIPVFSITRVGPVASCGHRPFV
jgi:deazaflavin-dependent oxidoreductase (nitroreductase family)